MGGFVGMLGRAATAAIVAAAMLAAAATARPAGARVAPSSPPQGGVKTVEKVVAPDPAPVGKAGIVQEVVVRKAVRGQVVQEQRFEVKAAAIAPAPPNAPVGDAAAQARLLQLKPLLRDELRLLTVAGPTPEQRRAIALAGGRKLREVAKTPENNRPRVNLFGKRILPNDPARLIHDAVEAAAREALAPEQFARLQAEARARADDRKEAVLMAIVARLDRSLDLGGDQREQILGGLRAAYDEATFPTLPMLAAWDNYMPAIPDGPIVAHLAPAQRSLWADAQKLDFRSITMMAAEAEPPGGVAADPDLEAALAEEPKP